jgi:hypothetical protein
MRSCKGFAVVDLTKEEIVISTVSGTKRAAQVNGLATLAGVMPTQAWSDDFIQQVWDRACGSRYTIREVFVTIHP